MILIDVLICRKNKGIVTNCVVLTFFQTNRNVRLYASDVVTGSLFLYHLNGNCKNELPRQIKIEGFARSL